jgi:hypothetical protein
VVTNHAVVPDVSVGHDQRVAANFSKAATFDCTAADSGALANLVVIADFQPSGFASIRNILWRRADGAKGKEAIIDADFGRSFDDDVRYQTTAFAKVDVRADNAVWTNLARRRHFGPGVDDGGGMNIHDRVMTVEKMGS